MKEYLDVLIIGAGPAGIGMAVTLQDFGIDNFLILEKGHVANSFQNWPKETRFITPSFTSNGFGMPDLNAVSIYTSPAYTLEKERLSGLDYQRYLEMLASEYELPILEEEEVLEINKVDDFYYVKSKNYEVKAKYIIMAVGEFGFPDKKSIQGAKENSIHYVEVDSWDDFQEEEYTILGGNESGIDSLINLVERGKKVKLLTQESGLISDIADPSISLSAYTRQRFMEIKDNEKWKDNFEIIENFKVTKITKEDDIFYIQDDSSRKFRSINKPFLATGFISGALSLAGEFFKINEKGDINLNIYDESTKSNNIFLVGPSVRQKDAIFCYIYKFRQRFAIIAEEISKRENYELDGQVDHYQKNSFYLDDCEQCDVICNC